MQTQILEQIKQNGSRLVKEDLLKKLGPKDVRFLRWTYDPMVTFGVTADEDVAVQAWQEGKKSGHYQSSHLTYWDEVERLLIKLSSRQLTGNAACDAMVEQFKTSTDEANVRWTARILNKDLDAGFGSSTINKVFPGTIREFEVALAYPWDPEKHDLKGKWFHEPKLDGVRVVLLDGVGYSRNGKTYDTIGHIVKELETLQKDFVFDGELMGSEDFDKNSGAARRKRFGTNTSLIFNVFDVIRKDEWLSGKTRTTEERKKDLEYLAEILEMAKEELKYEPHVKVVPWKEITNPTPAQLKQLCDDYIALGYEGAMLKKASSPYVFDRSDSVLKVKKFLDADGTVVGHYEGRGKYKGMLGGLEISFDGVVTRVGGGFSDDQRALFWKTRNDPDCPVALGSIQEAQFQNKTPDGKLRFPVWIRPRPDKKKAQ